MTKVVTRVIDAYVYRKTSEGIKYSLNSVTHLSIIFLCKIYVPDI